MEGWVDGRVDGWMDAWKSGCVDGYLFEGVVVSWVKG